MIHLELNYSISSTEWFKWFRFLLYTSKGIHIFKVKSIENGLEEIGSPKAVWQFGDDTLNIYQEYSPSELGMKSLQKKHKSFHGSNRVHEKASETRRDGVLNNSMRKFYLSASNGNLSVNTSFVSTDFSGDEFIDDEVYRYD